MAKLYLVRRNLEVFTGPMTLVEMKEAYKRMQFGLQDEVAGHCGPWVTFENLERIKKQYPEVARIVHEDMVAGWNISSDNEGKLINEDTKRIAIKSVRGMSLALMFLAIAIVAFVAALYMANAAKTAGKAKEQQESSLRPRDLQLLLDKSDDRGFDQYVKDHSVELVAEVSRPGGDVQSWLPYLRYYAFAHDGQVRGLDPKLLRGEASAAAPVDCSLKMWRRRWRASSKDWNELLASHQLVRAHWARLIAWDPYWIKRREEQGWIGTPNYYAVCLTVADRALADVGSDLSRSMPQAQWNKLGYDKIKARLEWMLSAVNGTAAAAPAAPAQDVAFPSFAAKGDTASVGLWTCFETARDLPALNKCRSGLDADPAPAWQAYNEERYGWNLLRLAAGTHGSLPLNMIGLLIEQADKMSKEDYFTRFDYKPEAELYRSLMQAGTPTQKAVERAQNAFPRVKLSH